jgi:hypothetical protein
MKPSFPQKSSEPQVPAGNFVKWQRWRLEYGLGLNKLTSVWPVAVIGEKVQRPVNRRPRPEWCSVIPWAAKERRI